jgi:hypothetical protein
MKPQMNENGFGDAYGDSKELLDLLNLRNQRLLE